MPVGKDALPRDGAPKERAAELNSEWVYRMLLTLYPAEHSVNTVRDAQLFRIECVATRRWPDRVGLVPDALRPSSFGSE